MCTVGGRVRSQELISRREEEKAEKKTLVKNLFVAKAVSHIVRDQGQDKKQCGPVCKMFKCAAFGQEVILAQKEELKQGVDSDCLVEGKATVEEDECGNLVIVDKKGVPQSPGENETSTDAAEKEEPRDNITDIYRVTNANEKIDRLATHQQHNSNMIHDLIIGRSKQRR